MDKKPLFVHVGFHKTATTWFQDHLFPFHPEIKYLGKSYPDHPCPEMKAIRDEIVNASDSRFSAGEVRQKFLQILKKYPLSDNITYGLSYEGFSAGDDWFGGKMFYVAERLHDVLEEFQTKIIVGIREQRSMLASMYSEYVKLGGTKSLNRLLFSPYSEGDSILDKLKYAPFLKYYEELFGTENIHVYLLEEFKANPEKISREIFEFLDLDPLDLDLDNTSKRNPRLSKVGIPLMRLSNHFFHGPMNNLSPITFGSYILSKFLMKVEYKKDFIEREAERDHPAAHRYKYDQIIQNRIRHIANAFIKGVDQSLFQSKEKYRYELDEDLENYLQDYYQESNRRLNQKIHQNLTQYGYALA